MTFRFLGTGTSVGVPQIGCTCPVCTSTDPRDKRRRCGAYVRSKEGAFLIDTPPEMRLACCEYGINRVDAIVLTHAHMDHIGGFDDVRRFNTLNGGVPLPCYAMPETVEQMHRVFPYISTAAGKNGLFRPQIEFKTENTFTIGDVTVERLAVEHGFPCCGYLLNKQLGYISDCHILPEETIHRLQGVEVLVLNCLRVERPHPTHLVLSETLNYIRQIQPKRALLIHMCHDLSHAEWLRKLADTNVEPAYDGLEVTLP